MFIELQLYWGEREIFNPYELVSRIIESMQTHGKVVLATKEARNPYYNGGFELLDSLCEFWKWDKKNITLVCPYGVWVNNRIEYNVEPLKVDFGLGLDEYSWVDALDWNKQKLYGLFTGRGTSQRLCAIQNHLKFKYRESGLASFHANFEIFNTKELLEYLIDSNSPYKEVRSLKPFSDIDTVANVGEVIKPINDRYLWQKVYEQIPLEIICETSSVPENFTASEKLLRCMLFKRPFLVIGSRNLLKYIRESSTFCVFEDYFGGYDECDRHERVHRIFEILSEQIESGKIYSILDTLKDELEHNREQLLTMIDDQDIEVESENQQMLIDYWAGENGRCRFVNTYRYLANRNNPNMQWGRK